MTEHAPRPVKRKLIYRGLMALGMSATAGGLGVAVGDTIIIGKYNNKISSEANNRYHTVNNQRLLTAVIIDNARQTRNLKDLQQSPNTTAPSTQQELDAAQTIFDNTVSVVDKPRFVESNRKYLGVNWRSERRDKATLVFLAGIATTAVGLIKRRISSGPLDQSVPETLPPTHYNTALELRMPIEQTDQTPDFVIDPDLRGLRSDPPAYVLPEEGAKP